MTDEEKVEKRKFIASIVGVVVETLTGVAVSIAVKTVLDTNLPNYAQYGKLGKVIKGITAAGIGGLSGAAVGNFYKDQVISGVEAVSEISSLIKKIKKSNDEIPEDAKDCNKEETSFA